MTEESIKAPFQKAVGGTVRQKLLSCRIAKRERSFEGWELSLCS